MILGTIRGTDARTVTDIPTGKQLPELKVNGANIEFLVLSSSLYSASALRLRSRLTKWTIVGWIKRGESTASQH
jgi:hypothetical protein